MVYTSKCECCK